MHATPPPPDQIRPGARLRHYKGGLYDVTGLCRIEATLETGVLYRACDGDTDMVCMRPLPEFQDWVTAGQVRVPRFTLVAAARDGFGT